MSKYRKTRYDLALLVFSSVMVTAFIFLFFLHEKIEIKILDAVLAISNAIDIVLLIRRIDPKGIE